MQGGILLSSDVMEFFHSLEVDIEISYRLLGPVKYHEMTGYLVKIGPTGVYFNVNRKDPLVNGEMMDVHLHVPTLLGVYEGPMRFLTVGKVLSCEQIGQRVDAYGCMSYQVFVRFCQKPRWMNYT